MPATIANNLFFIVIWFMLELLKTGERELGRSFRSV
jgi:hypothetical protein